MDWGYIRVSTAEQDYEIQREALIAAGVPPANIVADKASGKSLEGRSLVRLLGRLSPGDRVVATKLDRVGRSVRDVFNIVHEIAQAGATFRVLDMPALDTSDPVTGTIVLSSLAMVAELERYFILKRTGEGRKAAMAAGVRSITATPCRRSATACSGWTYADVASNARRIPSRTRCGRRPSIPSALVANPASRARANPSDATSIPTIQTGLSQRLRSALYNRSVPILPEPINAQGIFCIGIF